MENNYAFKSIEVNGATKEEAFVNTPFTAPVETWKNATTAFKKWKESQSVVTSASIKQFMLDYVKDKKIAPGAAAYIVETPAVKDTRKRPYTVEDVKHEGARRQAKVFQLIDPETNQILATTTAKEVPQTRIVKDADGNPVKDADGVVKKELLKDKDGNVLMKISSETKAQALKMAKEMMVNGYKKNIDIKLTWAVFGGDDIVARVKYTPSSNTVAGTYRVFGYVLD